MTNDERIDRAAILHPPTREEMWALSLRELVDWQAKLAPYYLLRSDILRRYGISVWRRYIHYPFYETLIERRKGEL